MQIAVTETQNATTKTNTKWCIYFVGKRHQMQLKRRDNFLPLVQCLSIKRHVSIGVRLSFLLNITTSFLKVQIK